MKRSPQHVTGGYLGSSYPEGNADRTSLWGWQSDLKFGKIAGGVVTIATLWRWRHDRGGGEIDMNWKELSFLPYLMLNVASSGVIWNEIFTPEAKLPKKPFSPKPKLPRKPCWNPAIIKPNPNPTLPYPNAIKYLPLVQICQKRPDPTHSDIKRTPLNQNQFKI